MNDRGIRRRTFLTAVGAAALTAAGALDAAPGHGQQPVPNFTGAQPSKVKAPANAADLNPIRGRASILRTQPCETTGWCRGAPERRGSSS
jgi:hypothetical protein